MRDETPQSKKSKAMGSQPDIRQFMLKKMKSQETSFSSPSDNEFSSNVGDSPSPSDFRESSQEEESSYDASDMSQNEYETCLNTSLTCLRFLLRQGLTCLGHEESGEPSSRGNFLELLKLLAEYNEGVKNVIFENASNNDQMTSPKIQKDLISCCAKETTKRIIQGLGDDYFSILVDGSSDVSQKEHLAICLRYVDGKTGMAVERFIGLVQVGDTTVFSLKSAILSLLMDHSLSPSRIRGQGYDGANNMKCEINDLKTLIMKDTPCAYHVHCFAHQLQLTLVAIARKNIDCSWFFETLANLLNVVGVSSKRREMIQVSQAQKVAQALALGFGELECGSGLNQELSLKRPNNTCGSLFTTLFNVINMFPTIVEVLMMIGENVSCSEDQVRAQAILYSLESFDFAFMAHLMLTVFGYIDFLSRTLQRRDLLFNAIPIIFSTKHLLQKIRDCEWETLLNKVTSFCTKYDIVVPDMDASYVSQGRPKRFVQQETNLQHFRVHIFLGLIDLQLNELNDRFDEVNMELLTCMTCLSPRDGFSSFNKKKILKLATFYPSEFSSTDLMALDDQLDTYIEDMRTDERFGNLHDLGALSMMFVKTKRHKIFPAIHLLIKLMLILPVETAGVERVSSGMTYVKNRLHNSPGDQLLSDCLVTYIENDVFLQVSDGDIIDRFRKMKTRHTQW